MVNKKIQVNTTLEKLIKNIDFEQIESYTDDSLDSMLTSFVTKYKNIEHFLNTMVLKIVVDHENKAVEDFNSRYILFYYEIENIILLKKILALKSNFRAKEITLCFIIDDEKNKDYHRIQDYVISLARYESNRNSNHVIFENSMKEAASYYVKGARESIINTLFGTNQRKPFRISNAKDLINIESIKDTLSNKYLNLQCPICKKVSENSTKYEITESTVNDIITIERNTSKVSFNCLHESYDIRKGKFFFDPADFDVDMTKYNDKKLQIWTLKNFYFIVKKELHENN
ncbi:MAG: hypothetical protein CL624_11650 [Arcobacter sp.]|nr:hypothetical protein [Arcobacter sp.]|tara:strand:+ start:7678 stop:8538 length:861 start_codon:yes stop_codon:yes gene_type:complete